METIDQCLRWNGHTHTHFCHHGDGSHLVQYINGAIAAGFQRYSITEHPPLPDGWLSDIQVMNVLAMRPSEENAYFECVRSCRDQYSMSIDLKCGLELDYLHGRTDFTEAIVNRHVKELDEALVSVHFLPGRGGMRCIDLSAEDFKDGLLSYYGSVADIQAVYYTHVEEAIKFAGTLPFATRIGHINLLEKFRLELSGFDDDLVRASLQHLIPLLKVCGVGVDVNTAGLRQPGCGKPYVPGWFIHQCLDEGIPVVYGSDCHEPAHVAAGWDWFCEAMEHSSDRNGGQSVGGTMDSDAPPSSQLS